MIISPIIPIWLMGIICVILLAVFKSKDKYTFIRQIIIISLLFIINLRVMYMSKKSKVQKLDLDTDIILVIDKTVSMIAEDYNGNDTRLEGVKEVCNYITEELDGAKISIITFGNYAQKEVPMTNDTNIINDTIDEMYVVDANYANGSILDLPKELLEETLEKNYNKDKSRKRIVFYISDGEITGENKKMESFKDCSKYIDNGAVLGFGTSKGGKMQITDWDGSKEYKTYFDEETFEEKTGISKIDEENLKQIANDMKIDYIHVEKEKDINKKVKEILKDANTELNDDKKSLYTDIYYIFVIPLLGMLVYEYINYRRKL